MEVMNDPEALKKFHGGYCSKTSCTTLLLIPPESVEIALDVLFTIDIKTDKTNKYQVKDDEKLRFEFAKKLYAELKQDSGAVSSRSHMTA